MSAIEKIESAIRETLVVSNQVSIPLCMNKISGILEKDKPAELPFAEAIELLRDLADIQNGPQLVQHEKEWNEIMEKTYAFLERFEK